MVDLPHERLQMARMRAGWREGKMAADAHGWPYEAYKKHENGSRAIRPKVAEVYAKAYGVSAAWILTGESAGAPLDPVLTRIPIRVVPVMELISVQELIAVADGAIPIGISDVAVDADTDLTPRSFAVLVDGQAMVGRTSESLRPGDIVVISPETKPSPGDIVLAIVGGVAMLRKYRPLTMGDTAAEFALVALNEDHPTVHTSIADGSIIVGRAIRHIRRL